MNAAERTLRISRALSTSVSDLQVDLANGHLDDGQLLCDLLMECHTREQHGRELAVRRRIAKLVARGKHHA